MAALNLPSESRQIPDVKRILMHFNSKICRVANANDSGSILLYDLHKRAILYIWLHNMSRGLMFLFEPPAARSRRVGYMFLHSTGIFFLY